MEYELGSPGQAYTKWAAQMAVGLRTGVPWVMCKQDDAPDPIVSDLLIFILPFSDIFLPLSCHLLVQFSMVPHFVSGVAI
jgi:hypothetical protein